jgi:hypothetical protein
MSNTGIVNIRGKEYQTVALRVQKFREAHPNWSLTSEVLFRDADCVVMKSMIADETGRVLATGHAEEYRNSSQINGTSALENAETSAHGRCLAALGLGGTEFASANEVQNAIHQQAPKKVQINSYVAKIEGSENVEQLKANFKEAFSAAQSDAGAIAAITVAKDKRKSELAA